MKVKDIITDELVEQIALDYADEAGHYKDGKSPRMMGASLNCDYRAMKLALMSACEMTLVACGYGTEASPIEASVVNDDGTWGA
jgi:hypothetical protein